MGPKVQFEWELPDSLLGVVVQDETKAAISSFRIFPYCRIEESAVNKRINDLEPRLQFSG